MVVELAQGCCLGLVKPVRPLDVMPLDPAIGHAAPQWLQKTAAGPDAARSFGRARQRQSDLW